MSELSTIDRRLLAACLRHARRHRGLTATNPSVGTLLVQWKDELPIVVGRGVTATGGRPHAERVAIDQAGALAEGATAYVTLEPCSHHGATPPCAQALIDVGVKRVVTAYTDPDSRVNGQGHGMLRKAGVEVTADGHTSMARSDLSSYLIRKLNKRPQITLKLAISSDGMIGRRGEELAITGPLSLAYAHRLRAECDAILVGSGTVASDDPLLTCRLPGLEARSPHRFVLDSNASLSSDSQLARTATQVPVSIVTSRAEIPAELASKGVSRVAAEPHEGGLALPELAEDMRSSGLSSLMVEGGAAVAASFLEAGLVDRIALFVAPGIVGDGIASPVTKDTVPQDFVLERRLQLGEDELLLYFRA